MQSTLKHPGKYNDAQQSIYRDNNNNSTDNTKRRVPLFLERQEEEDLDIFMIKLYKNLLPTKESHQRRIRFTKKVEHILHNEWPDYNMQVHVFGSSVNNLGTSNSDIDLCITTPCIGFPDVRILANIFQNYNMQNINCVPGAKVPIVRFFDPEFQLACDININNTIALENTRMVKTYVALDHRVRPLIMIIKHWTKQRDLNNAAFGGTLSSYTWTCMIINFLQTRTPPILPSLHGGRERFSDDIESLRDFGAKNEETLGGLFFAFFRRFTIEFDYYTQVLSVHQGRVLSKSEKGWDTGQNKYCLCVEEPFNLTRNLGNTTDPASVRGIRMEFSRVLSLLVIENAFPNILFDQYVSMRFSSYRPHYIQQPVLYNTPYLPFVYSSNNNNNSNNLPYHQQQHQQYQQHQQHQQHQYQVDQNPINHPIYGNYILTPQQSSPHPDALIDIKSDVNYQSIPSTLLSMLNLSSNYSHDRSVDSIFARYHREVLEENDRRRKSIFKPNRKLSTSSSSSSVTDIVEKDWPVLQNDHLSNNNVVNGTMVQKKKEAQSQPQQPQKQQLQSSVQKQQNKQQSQHQKQDKQRKQEKSEKQEKLEKQDKQEKSHIGGNNRRRRGSMSKRKYQQHQQQQKQTPGDAMKNKQEQPLPITENNQSSLETNSTPKSKNHRKKNKNKNQRRKPKSSTQPQAPKEQS